jgi:hypothetical protein
MNITIKIVPESEMRAEVDGADWYWDRNGDLQVRVTPMSDWRREILLAVHEMVEALMCKVNGVTQASVDKFDLEYDKTHTFDFDAGDAAGAPYEREHCLATAIERILCAEFKVNWESYDRELATSSPGPSKKGKRRRRKLEYK